MNAARMIAVAEARRRILAAVPVNRPVETIALGDACGRTLATDLAAKRTQPPVAMSAMDGYAVRAIDTANPLVRLKQIGESTAGCGFKGVVGREETVRIFTGAPVPKGSDAVLIQENARLEDGIVIPLETVASGKNIRAEGIDFSAGDILLNEGTRLTPANIGLAAAMNYAEVTVVKPPRIAILATGNELVPPGAEPLPDQIIASNSFAIKALVRNAGGEPRDLGIARDETGSLDHGIDAARQIGADVLVTIGGASVGDYDLVGPLLRKHGMEVDFWKIAMRPGKPLMHGKLGDMTVLGLPGNPVAAIITGLIFLRPLVRALCGDKEAASDQNEAAILGKPLRANDGRQDFLRAALQKGEMSLPVAMPFDVQDSSLLSVFAKSQCLVVREPHAPAAEAGDHCRIMRLRFC
ncbi:MAG TPA: gephyrin-like molybdotransferase Glp [Methylocella sp.]|nr:gephyrin-like molybdotransferase Glp [Methylocella sp.]